MSDDLSGFSLMDLFRSEADGQVALMTEGLLALEDESSPSPAALESLMRAAHSLKGAARIVGLDAAVRVAHALEDDFVAAQRGEFAIKSSDVDVLLKAVDLLGQIAMLPEERSASWQAENEGLVEATVASLERLRAKVAEPAVPSSSPLPLGEGRQVETSLRQRLGKRARTEVTRRATTLTPALSQGEREADQTSHRQWLGKRARTEVTRRATTLPRPSPRGRGRQRVGLGV